MCNGDHEVKDHVQVEIVTYFDSATSVFCGSRFSLSGVSESAWEFFLGLLTSKSASPVIYSQKYVLMTSIHLQRHRPIKRKPYGDISCKIEKISLLFSREVDRLNDILELTLRIVYIHFS